MPTVFPKPELQLPQAVTETLDKEMQKIIVDAEISGEKVAAWETNVQILNKVKLAMVIFIPPEFVGSTFSTGRWLAWTL